MSYTLTYEFPEEKIAGNVTILLSIIFTISGSGSDTTVEAEDYGLNIVDIGELTWEFNMDEYLIVPGRLNLQIFDRSNILGAHLFEDDDYIDPTTVKLEIKRGTGSYATEFTGIIYNESIERNHYDKTLSFEIMPETEILQRTRIYDFDNTTPLAPLGYYTGTKNLKTLIEDCYKLINPSVVLTWTHDWLLYGLKKSDNTVKADEQAIDILDIDLDMFFNNPAVGFTTIKDVLIACAREFYSFTGMIDHNRAFFRKLDNKALAEIQDVPNVDIISRRKFMKFNPIKYAYTQMVGASDIGAELPSHSSFTKLEGDYLKIDFLLNWSMIANTTIGNAEFEYLSDDYILTKIKDLDLLGADYVENQTAILQLWYNRRSNKLLNTAIELVIKGTEYSILKTIEFDGVLYQPILLKKNFLENKSTFELLRIE